MSELPIQQWINEAKQRNIELAKQRCLEFNDTRFTDKPIPNKTWQEGYVLIAEKLKQRPNRLAWCDLEAVVETLRHEYVDTLQHEYVETQTDIENDSKK